MATHDSKLDTVDGIVDSILADTNELQSNQGNWLTATGFATSSALSTHDSKLDGAITNITAIKAKTDNLPDGIKKNTALNNFEFLMVDSSDGYTPEPGLSVTATRSIDGAAFGACANTAVHIANGVYKINLAASDTNGNVITFRFTATGARDRVITVITNE